MDRPTHRSEGFVSRNRGDRSSPRPPFHPVPAHSQPHVHVQPAAQPHVAQAVQTPLVAARQVATSQPTQPPVSLPQLPALPQPVAVKPTATKPAVAKSTLEEAKSTQSVVAPELTVEDAPTPVVIGSKQSRRRKKIITSIVLGFLLILVAAVVGGYLWYQSALGAVDTSKTDRVLITIQSGNTPDQIAETLKAQNLIKNETAFYVYTRISGTQNSLQAGSYRLSPSETTPQIVDHLTKGTVDTFDLTFLPGATVTENKEVFVKAGYSSDEVNAAFSKTYTSPLFTNKPASADLEGYIYGDTYKFGSGATVEDVLVHIFDLYEKVVTDNNLTAQYAAQGLNLYQGITLASIIQRESIGGDEAQIAQVFLKRYRSGISLGSDVTYQYIADKMGVARDVNLDSPYNTRRYPGLPPGPISVPGLASLKAVAAPAPGEYLFFLSGDDNVTYFANTAEEHEANIVTHCKQKCQII